MLNIDIPKEKVWDDDMQRFVSHDEMHLSLEHSLISISRWESKWHKPFLDDKKPKTEDELYDYIRCMCVTQNVTLDKIKELPKDVIQQINDYINDEYTGTHFTDYRTAQQKNMNRNNEIMSSERIYYSMIAYNIPFSCEKWHLSRLMTLIRVCQYETERQNPKSKNKMSMKDIYARNRALNEQRRKAWHTKG